MDKVQAEENVKTILDIMERSARYANLSGISGVIAGVLALIGCWATYWITFNISHDVQNKWYMAMWVAIFILAIGQDFAWAQKKARRRGETVLTPAMAQVIRAVIPGILIAFVLSCHAMMLGNLDSIPSIWALCYGVAICAASMVSVKEVRIFGIAQLITGTIALFFFSVWAHSLIVIAVSFGLYHIIFGLWMSRKYGW